MRKARLKSKKDGPTSKVQNRAEQRPKNADETVKKLLKNSLDDYSKQEQDWAGDRNLPDHSQTWCHHFNWQLSGSFEI